MRRDARPEIDPWQPCHRYCQTRQFVRTCDMASRPRKRPVSYPRACHMCGAGFQSIRSDARYCSARCRKRAARTPLIQTGSPACDMDWEHDKGFDGEPDSVTRARAVDWQLKEGERLAEECALLRRGTEPHEISNKILRGVRRVARSWAKLWKDLSLAPTGGKRTEMIEFLLFAILLCLCKPLRTLVAFMFWVVLFVVVWNWPSAAAGVPEERRYRFENTTVKVWLWKDGEMEIRYVAGWEALPECRGKNWDEQSVCGSSPGILLFNGQRNVRVEDGTVIFDGEGRLDRPGCFDDPEWFPTTVYPSKGGTLVFQPQDGSTKCKAVFRPVR